MEALVDVRLGAFPETLSDLPSASAALVVADPDWSDLRAWSETGRFARRVLAPDGILLGYIGNRWCFEAINLLSANLTPVRLAFLPAQHEDPFDSTTNCLERGSFMVVMSNGEFFLPGPGRTRSRARFAGTVGIRSNVRWPTSCTMSRPSPVPATSWSTRSSVPAPPPLPASASGAGSSVATPIPRPCSLPTVGSKP